MLVRRSRKRLAPLSVSFPRSLLIIKAGGLGDGVLVRAVASALRARHPDLRLGFLVCPPTLHVLPCGFNAAVHFFDPGRANVASILKVLLEIRKMRYEAAIDFEQGTALSAALLMAARIPVRIGGYLAGLTDARAAMLTHGVEFRESDSMLTSFSRLAQVLDPAVSVSAEDLYVPYGARAKRRAENLWKSHIPRAGRVVAFHLGPLAWMAYRRWPLARFVELAERIRETCADLAIIVTGTGDERVLGEQFSAQFSGKTINLCGQCSVEETAAILEACDLVVCCDAGVMHLAAAMGAPTVGLFGPNTPRHWAPVGRRATYVLNNGLACSPCVNNYRYLRPKECVNEVKSLCMLQIQVPEVLAAARRVVRDTWLG
jgi:lipopolysaccharide heptosyltransferase II